MAMESYRSRLIDSTLQELMEQSPAVLLVGPRAAGKTTTARRHVRSVVQLDQETEAVAFQADPDAALRAFAEPVLLDEWQEVPAVLGAVKRAVDTDPRPGRFLLTGSVSAEHDPATWPGVGRLVRLPMFGLTRREVSGDLGAPSLVDRLRSDDLPGFQVHHDPPDLPGYLELALRGTFPEPALRLGEAGRQRWFLTYAEQIAGRDAAARAGMDPGRLRRYLDAVSTLTAGVVTEATICDMAGIDRKTAIGYERWLGRLHVLDIVPAWSSRRVQRLVRTPKRYLVDAGFAAAVLGADLRTVMRDGDLIGRLLDTFVASQVRSELVASAPLARLHHVRQEQGRHEIDLLVETGGDVVALEVKAKAAPKADDARHIMWLRDQLGDRFRAGVVLHTGPRSYPLGERIAAVPISALWMTRE